MERGGSVVHGGQEEATKGAGKKAGLIAAVRGCDISDDPVQARSTVRRLELYTKARDGAGQGVAASAHPRYRGQ